MSNNFVRFVKEQNLTLNNTLNLWNCRYTPAKVCDYTPAKVCDYNPAKVCDYNPAKVCDYTPAKVCDYNPYNRRNPKKYQQIRYRLKSFIDTNCIFPENLILKIGNVLEILNLHQWINLIPKRGKIWQWKELFVLDSVF